VSSRPLPRRLVSLVVILQGRPLPRGGPFFADAGSALPSPSRGRYTVGRSADPAGNSCSICAIVGKCSVKSCPLQLKIATLVGLDAVAVELDLVHPAVALAFVSARFSGVF
jgi:hypothetical protein